MRVVLFRGKANYEQKKGPRGRLMTSRRQLLLSVASFFILVAIYGFALAQSSKEAEGQAAERSGRLREALTHYVAALQSVSEGNTDDQRLRETIIRLVQRLSPPPAIPEEATRFSVRGETAINEAKGTADFAEAAKEFSKAVHVAPWWSDGYNNLAVAQEKAGQLNEAIRSLKLYLLAAPASPDAEKVKRQIFALEYRQERAAKEAVVKREEQEAKARVEDAKRKAEEDGRRRLEGPWATGFDPAYSIDTYRLSLSQNEVRIYWTGFCSRGRCETANTLTFRGLLRGDRSMTGSVLVESQTVGNRGAYCELTGGEFPATAQISPNYDQIEFSVQGQRHYTGLCNRAGTTQPVGVPTIRKR